MEATCEANKLNFEDEKKKIGFDASHEHLKKAREVMYKLQVAANVQDKREEAEKLRAIASHKAELDNLRRVEKHGYNDPVEDKLLKIDTVSCYGLTAKKAESYCFNMKTIIDDEKMSDKISIGGKELFADKCDDAIKCLDTNQLAKVEEFQEKQKEIEMLVKRNDYEVNTEASLGVKEIAKDPSNWPVTKVKLNKDERDIVKDFESVKTVSHTESSSGPECQEKTAEVCEHYGEPDPDHGNDDKMDPDALKILVLHEQKDVEEKRFQGNVLGFDIECKEFELNLGDDVFLLQAKPLVRRIAVHSHVMMVVTIKLWIMGLCKKGWLIYRTEILVKMSKAGGNMRNIIGTCILFTTIVSPTMETDYPKNIVMGELKRHVNNIITATNNTEMKALGGTVKL